MVSLTPKKLWGTLAGVAVLTALAVGAAQRQRLGLAPSTSGDGVPSAALADLRPGVPRTGTDGADEGGSGGPRRTDETGGIGDGDPAAPRSGGATLIKAPDGKLALDPIFSGVTGALGVTRPPATNLSVDLRSVVEGVGLDRLDEITRGLVGIHVDDRGLSFSFDPSVVSMGWTRLVGTISQWWASGVDHAARAPEWAPEWTPSWVLGWFDGNELTAPPEDGAAPKRVVLLVHGLDEPGWIWDDLAPALCEAGYETVRFEYPNDGPIAHAADGLGEALAALKQRGVRRVDIVAHSMGGLVARDTLTRARWYGGDGQGDDELPRIGRLITVATPNHGAAMAKLQALSEVKDQAVRTLRALAKTQLDSAAALEGAVRQLHEARRGVFTGSRQDGRGEAALDLLPDSRFLADLNSRMLPENVRVTVIAGRLLGARDDEPVARPEHLSPSMAALLDSSDAAVRAGAQSATAWLGDGLVTLDSAMLPGVDDFVVLPGNHQSLLMSWRPDRVPPAVPVIVERLGRE